MIAHLDSAISMHYQSRCKGVILNIEIDDVYASISDTYSSSILLHIKDDRLIFGCVDFVESATLEANNRILLIEAPNIIEWSQWKKIDNENAVLLLEDQLLVAKQNRLLIDFDIHMISGTLNDLSISIAEDNDVDKQQIHEAVFYF